MTNEMEMSRPTPIPPARGTLLHINRTAERITEWHEAVGLAPTSALFCPGNSVPLFHKVLAAAVKKSDTRRRRRRGVGGEEEIDSGS